MKNQQNHFMRFEYKYWVTEKVAERLIRLASPYLICDDFAPGGQRNTSLYLDSSDLDLVQMHAESAPDRIKLRVRAYGDPPSDPAFVEIKRKVKDVTCKRRAKVPLDAVPALLAGGAVPRCGSADEQETLEKFIYLMLTHRAEPKVLVTCLRQGYASLDRSEAIRLTLDRNVCYQRAQGYTLRGSPRGWTPLCGLGSYGAAAATLVEVKFPHAAPLWLAEAVQQLGLQRCSYSKYVSAMAFEALGPGGLVGLDRAYRTESISLRSR